MKKIILIVVIIAVILGVLFWVFGSSLFQRSAPTGPVTLHLWGLWEDESLIKPAIDLYEKSHPNVKIVYNHQTSKNYRSRVQTQVREGNYSAPESVTPPPDIFMIHNTWLPMYLNTGLLSTPPGEIMGIEEYNRTFYEIATTSFTRSGNIYALPLEVDGLALYYNETLLNEANVSVPTSWDEFVLAASKLTKRDAQGNIEIAGAAMGAPSNVDHWSDIVGLLFYQQFYQQPGLSLEQPATKLGADVLRFFTNFVVNPDPTKRVWDLTMESSTQAFYSGKLAFYFAPSWRAHELRVANPQLQFKTAPVPSLPGRNVGWGTFWGFSVSSRSPKQKEAWEFLKFLTTAETERLLYQQASTIRLFGQPYSRKDLQREIIQDAIAGSFVQQAPNYQSWYLASRTFDDGINDQIIKYYEDAVNSVLRGNDPLTALQTTQNGVAQVLNQFVNPAPSPSEQ